MTDSLPDATRVLLYFARCPDEELTSSDITQKFGFRNVATRLQWRCEQGLLKYRVADGEFVWSAGPRLLAECGMKEAA